MPEAKFRCRFALLDVTDGRHELERRLRRGERVSLRLQGMLDNAPSSTGRDDGVSIEFSFDVTSVEELQS